MNAKATTGKPSAASKPKPTKTKRDPRQAAMDAAIDLATMQPWGQIGLAAIADKAGLELQEMQSVFASKTALVAAIGADVDQAVLEAGPADGDSVRDRLFDMLMRRFDVLEPDRAAMRSIAKGCLFDPLAMLCLAPRFADSMAWMLEAAGVSSAGPSGSLKVKGLVAVQLATLKTWLDDDSEDLGQTMAALDKNLGRAEQALGLCRFLPGKGAKPTNASMADGAEKPEAEPKKP